MVVLRNVRADARVRVRIPVREETCKGGEREGILGGRRLGERF